MEIDAHLRAAGRQMAFRLSADALVVGAALSKDAGKALEQLLRELGGE